MGIDICKELHQNFIDFAYEANSQRAFPSALDGLKPGQRACLWEFFSKGFHSNKPHVKSAKVAGGVIASWWPHGDVAIYETFARMSQPWINNIPEVDWHGANGSQIAGPECASSRYTEARLSKAAEKGFFSNIKKNVVNMIPNFTEDDEWPELLPAIFPRLYVNGSQGIGMTIANHWAPGNLNEFHEKVKEYLSTGKIDYSNVYPDFPTGGIIINKKDLHTIYETGKGKIILRAKAEIKDSKILITELPYQVYVEELINEIKELVEKEELTGIKDIFNKSAKGKLLIEIECENSASAVLNKLFAKTELQKTFSPNQYALVTKVPELLNLEKYINVYVNHNLECLRREYEFELNKAKKEREITEGLIKALESIDEIIKLIKSSESGVAAKENLMKVYAFTEPQAKAIVDMKLGKLARLEAVELNQKHKALTSTIQTCEEFLASAEKQNTEFLKRLGDFVKEFGWARRTEVMDLEVPKEEKEIQYVEPEKCVVIMTEGGMIKRVPATSFKTQRRNGKGVKTQDDITHAVIRTNTIDNLMIFTNKGKMYRLLVDDIPVGTNVTKGQLISNLITMEQGEKPTVIYSIYRDTDARYVLFITKNGLVKKTELEEYIKTKKKGGIAAIKIKEDDELIAVSLVKEEDLIITTEQGMSIRVSSTEFPAAGRVTMGIKGIKLNDGDAVTDCWPIRNSNDYLGIVTENGLGKKISLSEFTRQNRAGKGITCMKPTAVSGKIVATALISDEDNILICGNKTSICISAVEIPNLGRTAIGNYLIKDNKVLSVSKV